MIVCLTPPVSSMPLLYTVRYIMSRAYQKKISVKLRGKSSSSSLKNQLYRADGSYPQGGYRTGAEYSFDACAVGVHRVMGEIGLNCAGETAAVDSAGGVQFLPAEKIFCKGKRDCDTLRFTVARGIHIL